MNSGAGKDTNLTHYEIAPSPFMPV